MCVYKKCMFLLCAERKKGVKTLAKGTLGERVFISVCVYISVYKCL